MAKAGKIGEIKQSTSVKIAVAAVVIPTLAFMLAPLFWALSMSFKREGDVFKLPLLYIPNPATFENYTKSWFSYDFGQYFSNSLRVAIVATLFILLLAVMNGYALSRYKFKGKSAFMLLLLSTQMLPGVFILVPLFIIFRSVGLVNSLNGVTLAYIGFGIPFNTLLMYGFINGVPTAIDEAAMVDGAGRFRVISTIILPLIAPGLVATGAYAFISCWNEFFTAFALITSRVHFTISVALRLLMAESSVNLALMSAQCIIALIPPLLMFALIQKHLVAGLTTGAVKS